MKNISTYNLSSLTGLSLPEIWKRCKLLQIQPIKKTKINQLVYNFTIEEVGRICLFDSAFLPTKIIEKETFYIYESKINSKQFV